MFDSFFYFGTEDREGKGGQKHPEQFLTERTWRSSGSGNRRKGSRPSATPGDDHDDHEGEHDDHDLAIIMMLMVVKMVNKCMTFISNY